MKKHLFLFLLLSTTQLQALTQPFDSLFAEVCHIVTDHFYDPIVIEEQFAGIRNHYQAQLETVQDQKAFSRLVNEMLGELNTSHTYYLTPLDVEYYQLAAIFHAVPAIGDLFDQEEIKYPTIGVLLEEIEGKKYIASVLEGSEAERQGLKKGDEILSADGAPFEPVGSFMSRSGEAVNLQIRRKQDTSPITIAVTPQWVNPKKEMLEAEKASIKMIEEGGKKIGYIHIYSYAGQEYQDALLDAIAWGDLQPADALIIDLRYGLGGASPSYLNIFNKQVPEFISIDRHGKEYTFDFQWRKPAAYLVNGKTRSGKELLAYGAKKYNLATVIGETTAGAVTAGQLFPLSNGDLLYLAVRGALVDGEVLEGKGVAPDVAIPADIRYSKGRDVQLEGAVEYMIGVVGRR